MKALRTQIEDKLALLSIALVKLFQHLPYGEDAVAIVLQAFVRNPSLIANKDDDELIKYGIGATRKQLAKHYRRSGKRQKRELEFTEVLDSVIPNTPLGDRVGARAIEGLMSARDANLSHEARLVWAYKLAGYTAAETGHALDLNIRKVEHLRNRNRERVFRLLGGLSLWQ